MSVLNSTTGGLVTVARERLESPAFAVSRMLANLPWFGNNS
jgi:hypothetical protein